MRQEQASAFDQEWEAMAHQMGFGSGNRLGYGDEPYQARAYQPQPMIFANDNYRGRTRPQNDLMPTQPGRVVPAQQPMQNEPLALPAPQRTLAPTRPNPAAAVRLNPQRGAAIKPARAD